MRKFLFLLYFALVCSLAVQAENTPEKEEISDQNNIEDSYSAFPEDSKDNYETSQYNESLIDKKNTNKEKPIGNNFLSLIGLAIAIGSGVFGFIIYRKVKGIENQLDACKNENDKKIGILKEKIDTQEERLSFVSSQYISLEKKFDEEYSDRLKCNTDKVVEQDLFYTEDDVKNTIGITATANPEKTERRDGHNIELYVGIPVSGNFITPSRKYLSGKSLYKIIDKGDSTAAYEFIDNPDTVIIAKRSISRFLESGCVVQGRGVSDFNKVRTIRPGIVRKNTTGWTIISKAIVELL